MLHLTLGAVHGAVLLRACHGVEPRLLGALVGEDEADVGFIGHHGGNARIHIDIVIDGNVVVAFGGDGHFPLTEEGVDKAVNISAVEVILLHNKLSGIDMIHPSGHIRHIVVDALARHRIHQHGADNICAAKEADGLIHAGADPVGVTRLVDFKGGRIEHVGGVVKPQMAIEIAPEVLGGGVADALVKAHHLHVLGHHVHNEVGGQTLGAVGEPLDPVAVAQARHTDGTALVVDLGVILNDLKLAHHVGKLAQFTVAKLHGGVLIHHGDLGVGDLLHLGGKVAVLHRQEVAVVVGADDLPAKHRAHHCRQDKGGGDNEGDEALLFQEAEVALPPLTLKARGEDGAQGVHGADQQHEDIQLPCLEVEGRQHHIEIEGSKHQRHHDVDNGTGDGRAHGLTGLTHLLGADEGRFALEALKIRVVPVCVHSVFSCMINLLFLVLAGGGTPPLASL